MKKILNALLITTLFTTNAYAFNFNYFQALSGFYVGLNLNANYLHFENQYEFDMASNYDRSNTSIAKKFTPNITIGYRNVINNYFTDIETNFAFANITSTRKDDVSTIDYFRVKNIFNLIGKIGFITQNNLMPYGLLGLQYTQLKRLVSFDPTGSFSALNLQTIDKTKAIYGKIIGIGIEHPYTDNIHFALEYQHVFYNDVSFSVSGNSGRLGDNNISTSQDSISCKVLVYV